MNTDHANRGNNQRSFDDIKARRPILGFVDSHCHLADARFEGHVSGVLARAQAHGIETFLQAGVGPEDWSAQDRLATAFPGQILSCFGLHPYWVSTHSHQECDDALRALDERLERSLGLGEAGLDFRDTILAPHAANSTINSTTSLTADTNTEVIAAPLERATARERQIRFFELQLQLASRRDKALALHVVRAHGEALAALKRHLPPRAGLVHAFTGAPELARRYLDLGFYISVGAACLKPRNRDLLASLAAVPLTRLLLESDSPDQPPPPSHNQYLLHGFNEPSTIRLVAERVAEIKGGSPEQILQQCRANLAALFFKELEP